MHTVSKFCFQGFFNPLYYITFKHAAPMSALSLCNPVILSLGDGWMKQQNLAHDLNRNRHLCTFYLAAEKAGLGTDICVAEKSFDLDCIPKGG